MKEEGFMRLKKFVSILTILMMIGVLLAGCSNKEKPANSNDSANKGKGTKDSSQADTSTDNPFEEHMEISFGWFTGEMEQDDPVLQKIQEQFNVTIVANPLSWNDRKEQVNVMVNTGDMPDILFYELEKGQLSDWAEGGAIRPLPEIDDRFPHLLALKEKMTVGISKATMDGQLWAWPKFNGANRHNALSLHMYVYRKDWADELGITKDVYTWEEFLDVARQFAQKDPGGNGSGKTIPIADQDFAITSLIKAYNIHADQYKKVNGQYVWGPAMPETMEGLLAFKKIYDEGLYWQDFYTGKGYDAHALYEAGLVGMYSDNFVIKNIEQLRTKLRNANPDWTDEQIFEATALMKVKGPDGKYWASEVENSWSHDIYSSSVDDKKMERIMYIMDWLASEEGTRHVFFGVEGVDWEVKDGEVITHWEKDENGIPQKPTYPARDLRAMSLLFEDTDYINPMFAQNSIDMAEEWILERTNNPTNVAEVNLELLDVTTPNYLKYGTLGADFGDKIKEIIVTSTYESLEDDWQEWLDMMSPKVDAVLDELNQ